MTEQSKTFPKHIAFDKWADLGFIWQGAVPVATFERLVGQIGNTGKNDDIGVTLTFGRQDKILWLTYEVKALLSVPCQRCLESLVVDVSGQYRMAILENDSKISYLQALDETADYVLLDEVCPDEKKMLPVADLLEDELLLALPLSPRHDDCEMLTDSVGEVADEPTENPFAILASLKGKL